MKKIHDYLDKTDFDYSDTFRSILDDKLGVDLEYLDPFNQPITEFQSYSYAMNLFIQRASNVAGWDI